MTLECLTDEGVDKSAVKTVRVLSTPSAATVDDSSSDDESEQPAKQVLVGKTNGEVTAVILGPKVSAAASSDSSDSSGDEMDVDVVAKPSTGTKISIQNAISSAVQAKEASSSSDSSSEEDDDEKDLKKVTDVPKTALAATKPLDLKKAASSDSGSDADEEDEKPPATADKVVKGAIGASKPVAQAASSSDRDEDESSDESVEIKSVVAARVTAVNGKEVSDLQYNQMSILWTWLCFLE